MTMPRQLDIVQRLVDDAVSKGARVLCGGRRGEGQFFQPTLLTDVDHTMDITQKETFGPVMVIVRVHSEDEAIRLANDSLYGLGSSVFTKDPRRAERIARRISAGMTVVNDYGVAYMASALPFGGVRISGFGRINGREGLRACCNEKAVLADRFPIHQPVKIYPVRQGTKELLFSAMDLLYGNGLLRRGKGVVSAARQLWGMLR